MKIILIKSFLEFVAKKDLITCKVIFICPFYRVVKGIYYIIDADSAIFFHMTLFDRDAHAIRRNHTRAEIGD